MNMFGKKFLLCVLILLTAIAPYFLRRTNAQDQEMVFVMAYPSDIGEMNPLFPRSERTNWFLIQIYDELIAYDEQLKPIPWLAESWEVDPNGKWVVFHIRKNAKWHDGQPLTGEDVKFTFEYWKNAPEDASGWTILQNIESVELVDDYTVRINLKEPDGFALEHYGGYYILPKHIWEGYAADDARWDDPNDKEAHIGSGPFYYVERVPDEYIVMKKFEDWWGKDVYQLPNVDVLRIEVIRGQAARILAMREGKAATERYELWGTDVNTVIEAPETDVITGVASQWDYVLGFNLTIPGLDDVRVRRAIAYAIDRDEIIKIARLGWGTPTWSVIPEAFYPLYYSEKGRFPEHDVDKANQILDEAGYLDVDGDGIREFPGDPNKELKFDMMVLSWDDISVDAGAAIAQELKKIGIEIEVAITDDAVMYPALYALPRNYRMYEMSHGYGPVPDHVWYRMHSSNDIDWGDNCYGLHSEEMDRALDEFMRATSLEDRKRAAEKVQILATELIPYIPLFLSDDTHAIRKEWVNYTMLPGGPFTSYNRLTMLYIYNAEMMPAVTETPSPTPAATPAPAPGVNWTLVGGLAVVALIVGIGIGFVLTRKK